MIMSLFPTLKFSKMFLIRLASRDMSRSKNLPEPNIKTILSSFNGSKDILIPMEVPGLKDTMLMKEEVVFKSILASLIKMLFQKLITVLA